MSDILAVWNASSAFSSACNEAAGFTGSQLSGACWHDCCVREKTYFFTMLGQAPARGRSLHSFCQLKAT